VTGEWCGVGHDDAVADQAIVRDVRLRHEEAIVARLRQHPAALRAAMVGDELADMIAPADARLGWLALVFHILRRAADGDAGKHVGLVADPRAAVNNAVCVEPHAVAPRTS